MSWLDPAVHSIVRRVRTGRDSRLRRPPRFRVVEESDGKVTRTIYYLCPDLDVPSGGIRTIYRHVDTLNAEGIPSKVVHKSNGFACSWFDHQTAVAGAESVILTPADVLVIPEFYAGNLSEFPIGPSLVIFNQNAYRTFDGIRHAATKKPCCDFDRLEAMLVVSYDNEEYVTYAFPELRVERIRNAVDSQVFYPDAKTPHRRIAVMPRRRPSDCRQLLDLLDMRGCLDSWDIVSIDDRTEKRTAELFRSCAVFFSFSQQEGFGMPPAEAMACGCYVVGFTGLAGREYFDPATSTPVEEGNVLAFAKAAERTLRAFDEDPQAMRRRALTASARILRDYSPERQSADLVAFFGSLSQHTRLRCRDSGQLPSGSARNKL